jgi:hypothetical protein
MMLGDAGNLEEWVKTVRELFPRDDGMPIRISAYMGDSDSREVHDAFDAVSDLSDRLEPYFDAFGSQDLQVRGKLNHGAIRDMCRTFRPGFVAALLIDCARQVHAPREPRSTYVGQLAISLATDVELQPRHPLARGTVERARGSEPKIWQELGDALEDLKRETCNWTRWPGPELARQICVRLSEVAPSWREALKHERSAWRGGRRREQRRDPAFRRAQQWHDMLVRIFRCLASPRGDLRLSLEYGLAVLGHCCRPDVGAEDAPASMTELAVCEVFTSVERALGLGTAQLEVGHPCRRKRVQRARLRVLTDWRETIESGQWQNEILPHLLVLASRIDQLGW